MKKNFKAEILINNDKLTLNHFIQEVVASMLIGLTRTLKEVDEVPRSIEIKIRKLDKPVDVNAHLST